MAVLHQEHLKHEHTHGPDCGHPEVPHGDHADYAHDGHLHKAHSGHWDECEPGEHVSHSGHAHEHGPHCGHPAMEHGAAHATGPTTPPTSTTDTGHRHAEHEGHWDDH